MKWALEMRQIGVEISYQKLQVKAARLDADFAAKTEKQQYEMIRTLCIQNKLVRRRKTHVAQEHPQATRDQAQEWLNETRPILSGPTVNKRYVINMDQTPIPFSLAGRSTLTLKGEKTVTVRASGNDKTRCTVCLTVCADGTKLKPMVIFKGTKEGRIAKKELPSSEYADKLVLAAQPAAWQDEENLNDWVDGVLVPHIQERAGGTPVHLFLDQFSAHHTESFKCRMEQLGVQLHPIPAGCTWLLQPVDVGIGKPFKDRIRRKWRDWMEGPLEVDAIIENPRREDIQQWVSETWEEMSEEIVQNSWLHEDFSWFIRD